MASFASPLLAVATLSPISHNQLIPLGFFGNLAQDIVQFALNGVVLGLFNILASIFTGVLSTFLFPPAPGQIPALGDMLWQKSVFAYFLIIGVSGMGYLAYMMIFPHNEKADPFRYVNRLFGSLILLAAGQKLLNYAFIATNELGMYIYPNSFSLGFAAQGIMGFLTNVGGGIVAFLVGAILLKTVALGTIVSFLGILAIRALLIYAVYGLFPVFLGLWVVDVGPFQYGNMVAELAFKAFALLLAFGILISAILATGGAIAGWDGSEDFSSDADSIDEIRESGGDSAGCSGTSVEGYNCERGGIIIKMMAFFGSILASFALGTSSLGMLISMRGSGSSVARRGGGGGGDGGSYTVNEQNAEPTDTGPSSISGHISQAKADYNNADSTVGGALAAGAHAVQGGSAALGKLDSGLDRIAQSGNKSVMQSAKDMRSGARDTYDSAKGWTDNQFNGPSSSVEDIQQNADDFDGESVNMSGVTYDEDSEALVDHSGNEIDYDEGVDGPELEDGETYDIENAEVQQDDDGNLSVNGTDGTEATERTPPGHDAAERAQQAHEKATDYLNMNEPPGGNSDGGNGGNGNNGGDTGGSGGDDS